MPAYSAIKTSEKRRWHAYNHEWFLSAGGQVCRPALGIDGVFSAMVVLYISFRPQSEFREASLASLTASIVLRELVGDITAL